MPNSCLICLRSSKFHPNLSMHKFPSNPVVRSEWLKVCGFLESDYGPNRRLCSRHFEDSCFTGSVKRYLKPKSIPTLHLKCTRPSTHSMVELLQAVEDSVFEISVPTSQCASIPSISAASSSQMSNNSENPGQNQVIKMPADMPKAHATGITKCALNYCKSYYSKRLDGEEVSFFGFPKDPTRCARWVSLCNEENLPTTDFTELHDNYKLCSIHFEDKMFANIQKDLLFDHAIPSLFQNGSVTILESQFIIFVPNDPKTTIDNSLEDSAPNDHNYCSFPMENTVEISDISDVKPDPIVEQTTEQIAEQLIKQLIVQPTEQIAETINRPVDNRVRMEHNYIKNTTKKKSTKQNKDCPIVKKRSSVLEESTSTGTITITPDTSLFGVVKDQRNSIELPSKWFCELSLNSIKHPIAITFFSLNNYCYSNKRYLERQLVLTHDSEIAFIVNGKTLSPSDVGLKNYQKPTDILSMQNLVEEFSNIYICQGISKPSNSKSISLNVFESTDRWWHPNCTNNPENNKSFLCYSCKVLNSVLMKMHNARRTHQQKPLGNTLNPKDNHQKPKSTKSKKI